jgi:hypothetical protein
MLIEEEMWIPPFCLDWEKKKKKEKTISTGFLNVCWYCDSILPSRPPSSSWSSDSNLSLY